MKSLSEVTRILEEAGLKHLLDDHSSLLEPAISLQMRPAKADDSPIGSTKLGGLPDVPADFVWPMDGKWLTFMAQLNLESLHKLIPEVAAPLPATGMLSFFFNSSKQPWGLDLEDRTSQAVVHFDQAGLRRLAKRPARANVFSANELSVEPTWTVRPASYFRGAGLDFYESYGQMYSQQNEDEPADPQLFGYPFAIQNDMRGMCQSAFDNVGSYNYCYDPDRPGFEDWQLLLQFGSSNQITSGEDEMMWGDAGCLYFWIRRQDLAERRWDRVWVMLQSF